jgi:hypothetical protein
VKLKGNFLYKGSEFISVGYPVKLLGITAPVSFHRMRRPFSGSGQ